MRDAVPEAKEGGQGEVANLSELQSWLYLHEPLVQQLAKKWARTEFERAGRPRGHNAAIGDVPCEVLWVMVLELARKSAALTEAVSNLSANWVAPAPPKTGVAL